MADQHDMAIADQAGAAFLADLNLALLALTKIQNGPTEPATKYAYMLWADTTSGLLKQRNAANSAWLVRGTLGETFVLSRSSNTILTGADVGRTIVATAGFTQTLTAAATLGDGWFVDISAQGFSVVIDPNGSETIDGATTKTVTGSGRIYCNGSAFYTIGFAAATSALPTLFYSGLQCAWASTTTMTLGTGKARDAGDANDLTIGSAITGTLQAAGSWAAGTGQNKLDTGVRANSTTYHAHIIRKTADGTADFLYSTAFSSGGVTLPGGYAYGRRVKGGQFRTDGSGNIIKTIAVGNTGQTLDVPVRDISTTNPGTAAVTRTLSSIPTGGRFRAKFTERHQNTSNNHYFLTTALTQTDTAASSTVYTGYCQSSAGSVSVNVTLDVVTNSSAQIRTRQDASGVSDAIDIVSIGWFDDVEVD